MTTHHERAHPLPAINERLAVEREQRLRCSSFKTGPLFSFLMGGQEVEGRELERLCLFFLLTAFQRRLLDFYYLMDA